jgi:hypothetical protein
MLSPEVRQRFLEEQRRQAVKHARALSHSGRGTYVVREGKASDGTPRYVVCPYYAMGSEGYRADGEFMQIGPVLSEFVR